ncbi:MULTISPECIES: isoleucine--tRNA ligase [Marinomonas]|uniref:Isoleucine--tRNA ligase n=1 Tax=Marinomonas rhodophyticola TaxID=2992803 RepID=A0ABT3KKJ6_9GAMM|nr:isoleucine--tRNA ligase [Marinomonas sp. KJ51-3]MCW4631073.1 isoleucine--tRNA ligase [Marinomonas sp. KJ51-3]
MNTHDSPTHVADEADNTASSARFSFVEAEHAVLKFWQDKQIFKRSLEASKPKPDYVFYDGPPFATGLPHHGHLVASTIKDIIPRYFTMKGFHVERRFGWDCHGLPIEHEIDKSLGMSAKEAVESLGIARYNAECRGIVQRYASEWEKTITRLGRWVDFENDYRTMEPWYMESVWWVFKQLWDKGLVYQGDKVIAYSTELETVLSNFEASSNYKEVQDPAITVLFKLTDEDAYFAAWTTTPWTLPSNLALCVGPNIPYVKVHDATMGKTLWLAQAQLDTVCKGREVEILDRALGAELSGKHYEPLFPYFSHLNEAGAFHVFADDFVSTGSGTGIVHIAPAFGEDDNRVCKANGLQATVCPLDSRGRFTHDVADYQGQYVKDADKAIMQALKARDVLYRQETIVHSYPFCPRSDTPIIYRSVPSWYIKVEQMRGELLANNEQINWVPDHIQQGRMGKWLEGAIDWSVSRNRYWGTPLPIWVNDVTGNHLCLGSRQELKAYTGADVDDLHRDHVDELSFSLTGEAGTYRRIAEVFDCWFESGAMPYAQVHYPFENKEQFEHNFPAAFIAEGVDQTRGWFYTLQVLSQCLFGQPAFKNVIVNGIVMAEDGKKMSKRLKNYTPPDTLMENYGADALRLYLINSGLVKAEEQRFADTGVQDMVRQVLLPWLNGFRFFATYAEIDQWQDKGSNEAPNNILDQWILSRLQTLTAKVNQEMQAYHLYNVVPALFEFIEDLTNGYIRLNRARFWQKELNADKQQAFQTLYRCLDTFNRLMAPFTPFMAEHLYQALLPFSASSQAESVHLCDYPSTDGNLKQEDLEASVARVQHILVMGRQLRNDLRIKLKTPLKTLTVLHKDAYVLEDITRLKDYIQTELNIKNVLFSRQESDYIDFYAKANFPVLGKRLGKQMKHYAALIAKLDETTLDHLEKQGEIELDGLTFNQEEIQLFRQAKASTVTASNRFISINIDPELTEELIAEGAMREIVSHIQKLRKQQDYKVLDRIHVSIDASDTVKHWCQQHLSYIQSETLADEVHFTPLPDRVVSITTDLGEVKVAVEKATNH